MKARFIKLNDGGLQSCLNTMFTQDCKRKCHARVRHHYENKAFIKKFCEEAKLTYDRTKGVDAKCKGVSKKKGKQCLKKSFDISKDLTKHANKVLR